MIKLHVGQIIYILDDKTRNIYPGQVESELLQRTLKGETIQYVALVNFRDEQDKREYTIDEKNASNVFVNSDSLKDYLIQRASDGITSLIDEVVALAQKSFDIHSTLSQEAFPINESNNEKFDEKPTRPVGRPKKQRTTKVTMPDGEVVNVVLPE